MKFQNSKAIYYLIAASMLFSCSPKKGENTYSSSRNLFIEYISANTGGVISARDNIKIHLAKEAEEAVPGQEVKATVFSFDPSIAGKAVWEDKRTIVFQPSSPLPQGQSYKAVFFVKEIFPDAGDKGDFKFTFSTLVQDYEVSLLGFQITDITDLSKVNINGTFQTADFVPDPEIEKFVTASQDGNPLPITWVHNVSANKHKFLIQSVARKESAEEVIVNVEGKKFGAGRNSETAFEVPALGDFKVISAQVVHAEDTYISVQFSDPLLPGQDLRGLVVLSSGNNFRTSLQSNELRIYPAEILTGEVQLTLFEGIRNGAGYQLKTDFKTSFQFSQIKPEVKLAANKGTILPSTDGVILPFEAVGLRSVRVVVTRIFADNVLQYLQVNNLGNTYQLNRVGRPVSSKTISLESKGVVDLNKWNRFTLDLRDLVKAESGALYQIQISFSRHDALYTCDDSGLEELPEEESDNQNGYDETYWDEYEEDYYYYDSDYDWQQRDNPCNSAYYRNKSVTSLLFSSDLGLIAKRGDKGNLIAFVTNLLSTDPVSGATVSLYDYQQQLIESATTDGDGIVKINPSRLPFTMVVRKGDQYGYLKLNDGNALSVSSFNVTGNRVENGIKGFIYGERGVWRPGDVVHLSFMMEDREKVLPKDHPVILELFDPLNQLTRRMVSSESVEGIYVFHVQTNSEDPTGNWLAKIKVGGTQFTKTVKIEAIKPNRLKVNLDFHKEKLTALDRNIVGTLEARWLHGAIAKNLKAEVELKLVPVKTTFDNYPSYQFDDPAKDFYSEPAEIFSGRLNEEGVAQANVSIDVEDNAPGALRAIFDTKVYEEGGDFSINQKTIPYLPYKAFAGMKIPEGDRRGILVTDKDQMVDIVSVDANGNPTSEANLQVELYKLDWRWWWDNSFQSLSNYVSRRYHSPIKNEKLTIYNGKGQWKLRINQPDWGRYYLRVTDLSSNHSSGEIIYMDWPGWAGKQREGMGDASMLVFEPDKEEYTVGENMQIRFPSSKGSHALVSLETGSAILETFWTETGDGETSISIPVTPQMSPNVYINISLLQPHGQKANDLPIRLYGISAAKVLDPSTELHPELKLANELRPGEQVNIEVSEKNGKPMAYTVAVVDEGLLDITNFKTPEPWSAFYAREALGVKTWDMFDQVIGAYGGRIERILPIGGDEGLKAQDEKETNRFKPVVQFFGPYYLQGHEKKKLSFIMPQYVGSVRSMIVAGLDGAYGSSEVTTPVRQPLMVLATLPRVAGPGEELSMPVNLFAMKENIGQVNVKVEASGQLALSGSAQQSVNFKETGDQVVFFALKAKQSLGQAKVKVTATAGSNTAVYDIEMLVRASNPEITDVASEFVESNQSVEFDYTPVGLNSTNHGTLEISSLPPINLEQRLKYLFGYPHGCIEQTVSSVFPQLYLENFTEVTEEQKNRITNNINAAIERLKMFQVSQGGFTYWPGESMVSPWGTNYAGHFLIEAKKQGYFVPESMFNNWKSYQTTEANRTSFSLSDPSGTDLVMAYRLYTLAISGSPAMGAMNRLRENTTISSRAKWRLALAYAIAGMDQAAAELVKDLSMEVKSYRELGYTFGSTWRDEAMILETLVKLGRKSDAFQLLEKLASKLSDQRYWMSTQTTAYALIAIATYVQQNPIGEKVNVEITENGKTYQTVGERFVSQVSLANPEKNQKVSVRNMNKGPVYIKLIKTGIPLEEAGIDEERNIGFEVSYVSMDGQKLDIQKLLQGTNFKAVVSIHNPGERGVYDEIALTQIFPSGWEIINTRLNESGAQAPDEDSPEYKDIRDDRVLTYFDLRPNETKKFVVLLNATYAGRYYQPAVKVGAMYDNDIEARKTGKWVEVVKE